jgi:hypothetical protein
MTTSTLFSRLDRSPWFHLLGGPILWSAHFLASYASVEFACRARLPVLDSTVFGLSVLSWSVLAFTLAATLAAVYVGRAAYRSWHRLKKSRKTTEPDTWELESGRFMALSGMALSALFALTILLGGLPALVLGPCA